MNTSRRKLQQIYGSRYKSINVSDLSIKNRCYYCGEPATEIDHVPSLSSVQYLDLSGIAADYLLIPCCRECNLIASDDTCGKCAPHETVEQRFEYIKKRLSIRKKKLLSGESAWTEEEIERAFDGEDNHLSRSVSALRQQGEIEKGRVSWCGYPFTVDGRTKEKIEAKKIHVWGCEYENMYIAVSSVAKLSGIKRHILLNYVAKMGGDVEKAVKQVHLDHEEKVVNRMIKAWHKENKSRLAMPLKFVMSFLIDVEKVRSREMLPAAIHKLEEMSLTTNATKNALEGE